MTKQEWLDAVRLNAHEFRGLIEAYHPARGLSLEADLALRPTLPITAPKAEEACKAVRKQIQEETLRHPLASFQEALEAEDVGVLMSLFADVWFGVPESADCWQIPGFGKMVNLIDDPPEEEEIQCS